MAEQQCAPTVYEPGASHDDSQNTNNDWSIYPSCDIRLGEYFRNNPRLQNSFLLIDEKSIRTNLATLDPNYPNNSPVQFELTHPETLSKKGKYGGMVSFRDTESGKDRNIIFQPRPNEAFLCRVAVSKEDIGNVLDEELCKLQSYDEYTQSFLPNAHWYGIHELQHAVDIENPGIMRKEKRCRIAAFGSGGLTMFASNVILNSVNASFIHAPEKLSVMGSITAMCLAIKAISRHLRYRSPLEKRAYKHDKDAFDYPAMTTLVHPSDN